MFVLGIDPGLTRCGYGVVQRAGRRLEAVAAGVVRTDPSADLAVRLADVHREVRALIDEYRPDEVAVERVLFQVNVRTAMQTGQASGVVMAAAAGASVPVTLYSPNEVKEAVAGWGGADKEQVERMVRIQLGIDSPLRPADAADAVAVALCHQARIVPSRSDSTRRGNAVGVGR
ncbi:MAG: crossover junction endodeoxyribonuclease RuvC [Actinomycetota bacterium]|nr:crossover junction endodeoxyribonuclease RuvC [Actinomycetota bacterium]MED6327528.1 crossover junction endodeoxyribonuclease RuvC [Actinomycetota bacterium]